MVCLMVRTDCHYAEEPEAEDAGKLVFASEFDTHGRSLRGRFGGHCPSGCHFQHG